MQKVYIVYYDNGMSYENHYVSVDKIFASKDVAHGYAEGKNADNVFVCMSKEEYYSQHPDDIHCSYEEYQECQYDNWQYFRGDAKYYVVESDVIESL